MANKRKYFISKQDLIDNKVTVTFDENNQPKIFQEFIATGNRAKAYRWKNERTIYNVTTNHSYGKPLTYLNTTIKVNGKTITIPLGNLVWIYFNDTIPDGYDIDHIDNNPFNNNVDNLQLLTIKENIQKRPYNGANQFMNSSQFNTPEEYYAEREKRRMKREQLKEERRKLKEEKHTKLSDIELKIANVKQQISDYEVIVKQTKQEWHKLNNEKQNKIETVIKECEDKKNEIVQHKIYLQKLKNEWHCLVQEKKNIRDNIA